MNCHSDRREESHSTEEIPPVGRNDKLFLVIVNEAIAPCDDLIFLVVVKSCFRMHKCIRAQRHVVFLYLHADAFDLIELFAF